MKGHDDPRAAIRADHGRGDVIEGVVRQPPTISPTDPHISTIHLNRPHPLVQTRPAGRVRATY